MLCNGDRVFILMIIEDIRDLTQHSDSGRFALFLLLIRWKCMQLLNRYAFVSLFSIVHLVVNKHVGTL